VLNSIITEGDRQCVGSWRHTAGLVFQRKVFAKVSTPLHYHTYVCISISGLLMIAKMSCVS
jgi:hypothetical protein